MIWSVSSAEVTNLRQSERLYNRCRQNDTQTATVAKNEPIVRLCLE